MIDGGYYALHPAGEAKYVPDGEMGCWPIGNDCAKKLGLEWCHAKATLAAKGCSMKRPGYREAVEWLAGSDVVIG